jgi:hypothetical protein
MSTDIFNKPPSLEGLFPEKPVTETVPQSTIRNQASTAAVLSKQEPDPVLKKTIINISESVQGGGTFSEALTGHPKIFNKLYTIK